MEQTPQQIFDTVVNHLRAQGAKSVALNEDGSTQMAGSVAFCLYRSADGKRKCAAGAVITDEEYLPEMEGNVITAVMDRYKLTHLFPHRELLAGLQQVHDFRSVEEWEENFKLVADQMGLIYTPHNA